MFFKKLSRVGRRELQKIIHIQYRGVGTNLTSRYELWHPEIVFAVDAGCVFPFYTNQSEKINSEGYIYVSVNPAPFSPSKPNKPIAKLEAILSRTTFFERSSLASWSRNHDLVQYESTDIHSHNACSLVWCAQKYTQLQGKGLMHVPLMSELPQASVDQISVM